jgi:GNAT superfamily N-acetyltransferase
MGVTRVTIRRIEAGDEARWRELWDAYTRFYEREPDEAVTRRTWSHILDPAYPVYAIVAETGDGRVIGIANYVIHENTSTLTPVCYLEDLFVDPARRAAGVGKQLIDWILAESKARGWSRLYWQTKENNYRARGLYDKYGPHSGFVRYVIHNSEARPVARPSQGRNMDFIERLESTRDRTLAHFASREDQLARTYGPGKWPVRFILHHLADAETVLFDRIRRTISEPRQVLWAFDQDAWAKGLDYSRIPLELSRRIYESVREGIIYHARLHYEKTGAREFVHSETGLRTLKDEFDKVVWHNEQHLEQIERALKD